MTGQKKIPSFDLTRNYNRVKEEVRVALDRVLETQHFILGPEVEALEKEIAAYLTWRKFRLNSFIRRAF